jgi:hypothetical protein
VSIVENTFKENIGNISGAAIRINGLNTSSDEAYGGWAQIITYLTQNSSKNIFSNNFVL